MTILSNPYSSPRCIDGSGWIHIWLGSYARVTSGSAVPSIPRWRWPRPPVASSALIISPLALWSRKGIGFTLVLLVEFTCWRGMARRFECMYNYCIYIVLHQICHYYPVSVPQPCLYPTLTPYTTVAFAPVVPDCECATTAP